MHGEWWSPCTVRRNQNDSDPLRLWPCITFRRHSEGASGQKGGTLRGACFLPSGRSVDVVPHSTQRPRCPQSIMTGIAVGHSLSQPRQSVGIYGKYDTSYILYGVTYVHNICSTAYVDKVTTPLTSCAGSGGGSSYKIIFVDLLLL